MLALRDGAAAELRVRNLDVRRDFTDVRDVTRPYRLLLERLVAGEFEGPTVVNVASGQSVTMREILDSPCAAGVQPVVRVDPTLVRQGEPDEIVGSPTLLEGLTRWRAEIPLRQSLADVFAEVAGATAA